MNYQSIAEQIRQDLETLWANENWKLKLVKRRLIWSPYHQRYMEIPEFEIVIE